MKVESHAATPSPFLRDVPRHWWILWLIGLAILIAIGILKYYLGMLPEPIFDTVFNTLAAFVLVTFFTNRLLVSGLQETVTQSLGIAFSRGEGLFHKLDRQTRAVIVENALTASLGQPYGENVYKEVVRDYMEGDRDYRAGFNYEITCHDRLAGGHGGLFSDIEKLFPTKDFLWIAQDLVFTQHGFLTERALPRLTARIALSSAQFENAIRDPSLYFREFLQLDDQARAWLEALNETQLQKVLVDYFQWAVSAPDGRPVGYTVNWEKDGGGGKSIGIAIDNHNGQNEGSGCRLRFCLPQRRDATFFVVTMPKPTEAGARILFKRSDSMSDLVPVVYLPRSSHVLEKQGSRPDQIEIRTRTWTFPTGGITFTWRD